jgi:hypothetical protein
MRDDLQKRLDEALALKAQAELDMVGIGQVAKDMDAWFEQGFNNRQAIEKTTKLLNQTITRLSELCEELTRIIKEFDDDSGDQWKAVDDG